MKNRNISGFTLMELMIAAVLFCTLSVVTYNFMKSSMDSTLKQKTQQMVNENAKNLLKMIVDDLKSSTVLTFQRPIHNGNLYSYPSSVICPATNQFSSTLLDFNINDDDDIDALEKPIGVSNDGLNTILNNHNLMLFYSRNILENAENDNWLFQIIGYRTRVNNAGDGICRVERISYDFPNVTFNEWPGISMGNGNADNAIDLQDVTFANNLGDPDHTETVLTLPNKGDIALIYINRGIDSTTTGTPRFASNQYHVKVVVFQTIKRDQSNNNGDYFSDNGVPDNAFTNIFLNDNDDNHNTPANRLRNNYRYAELSSSVFVESATVR